MATGESEDGLARARKGGNRDGLEWVIVEGIGDRLAGSR